MPVIYNTPPETAGPAVREAPEYQRPSPDPHAPPLFSVVVPAYNEGGSLKESAEHLLGVMNEAGEPFEVIIVNDGSRDETPKVAEDLAARNRSVRVLHHERNRGLGAALRTAIQAARGEYIVGSPADSPLDTAQLQAFRDTMEARGSYSYLPGQAACDIAVGFRPDRPGYRSWMRFCSGAYRWMLRILFWTWLRDFNWISMYRRSVFESVSIEFDGFVALPEILVKARRAGFRLRQVSCPMKPRRVGRGTVSRPQVLFGAFANMVRLWLRVTFGGSGRSGSREARKQV
jgi:cellulose synthase/poly-beta-1,6-N-acetylglucosamine synthase-like glycosyltransferase